ncbi:hypothetical protein C2G38_2178139 [Gigaspora rosea]|uniref:TLDc domain-containing protein n=1 Tax=Gigaspora rosea TaxID=44941 RepID=A0A397VG03_9GLOM|nr:hypothetical protein C2G38_2178139 [Gigaspora rosea]
MKSTLQNCLPHIRYFQISNDDAIDYLLLYRQLLDDNLWDDIIKNLLSPNRSVSSVINPPRADVYSATNNPYEFKLLFRGARDGFTPDSFWKLCDRQINVVIAKIKGIDEILGGYNPIRCTIQNSILSRVICNLLSF